ncbi:MAG: YigZ family protein [Clostridia bacterium]|jgi:uncharacterized YigZ family protein|nr:YigZ family protein [Clostridia bacterium]
MIEKYLSVAGECVTEKVIEKSKFITATRHVENEEEARAFIAEITRRHSDATHNCYAYIPDLSGNAPRFSDDGEPQGTAGIPMLEVLKVRSLVQVATVVTRYFGGVKLGAGGLVRAYSGCVAENLDCAALVSYEICCNTCVTVNYTAVDTALRFFAEIGADVVETQYLNDVKFIVAVRKSQVENFIAALVNRLNGKVIIERQKEYYFPFKV